jgi:hypothetical protein
VASATCRVLAVALVLAACGCSGSSTASTGPLTTVVIATTTVPATGDVLPRVDLIDDAVAALEAKLGGPQRFFEINATSRLVNLFVELNGGKLVQPWVYLDGELSSTAVLDANGHSFAGTALDFDPTKVLSHVQTELPQSRPDVFFIEGGEGGVVRYSVTVTSQQGGQLVVVVGPDGTVKSVDT